MASLNPFRAIRYTPAAGHPAELLAPPYDVIDEEMAASLRGHPHNAVRLVLPEGPDAERYSLAARRLRAWLARGVLREDTEPSVYVYRQEFPSAEGRATRWSLIGALRLVPFGDGGVLPHEETHAGPKRDRLALSLACRAQLSAAFLTAEDPDGELLARLQAAPEDATLVLAAETSDEVAHDLWRVGGARGAELCEAAGGAPLLIADGHHRYETALEVRRRLPDAEGAGRVLACVASETDPGLRIHATHRSLACASPEEGWAEALEPAFQVEALSGEEASDPTALAAHVAAVAAGGPSAVLGVLLPGSERSYLLRPRAEALGTDPPELGRLASVLFDRLALRPLTGMDAETATRNGTLRYLRDPDAASRAAGTEGAAFLLPPVRVAEVRRAALAGARLPPKSTFFAPKIPSGLCFRRI